MLYYTSMEHVKQQLTHRQRQALATKQLIIDTSRDLFLGHGYTATTMEAIAERAGVAVSTIYASSGNKRAILRAIREQWHQESGQRAIYQQAQGERDAARRLTLAAHATRRQWETGATMITIYRGAAAADREAAAELEEALNGRRRHLDSFIATMDGMLRPGLDHGRAAAIFRALTQVELYQELVEQAGWTPDDYEAWLAEVLQQQLLP